ncbi:hypothetical protein GQ55_4G177300 [Panicum hallii var. hallii]|uniref:DUF8039 domain-containing protein n=1 Tax=Panicum hallii var. hallii TaxID=1504633 RepID=A0A2T7DYT9_9POAL|nr:hypothetical protein GQ55_4G177300 [Panicum hallii var. hallii]
MSPTPTNSCSDSSASSQRNDGERSSQAHSAQTAASSTRTRGSRTQTKWPEDKLTATGLDEKFWPTPDAARERFVLVCGLIARERVSINRKLEDLSPVEKEQLFKALLEKLEYPANLEPTVRNKAIKAAMSEIATLQRRFKAHLRRTYVRQEESPFEKHGFLKPEDWEVFVQETNSPFFQRVSQEMKDKRALHNKPHKMGRKGYHGKRKEWEEEDAKLAREGKENPWDQFPGRSRSYLWARAAKRMTTSEGTSEGSGDITFSNPAVVGLANKVKDLASKASDGSFTGVRENDILTAALENPEHRGRVRGVSSSVGWGKGFGEEFAGMYRKKRKKTKERSDAEKEKIVGETAIRVINMLRQAGVVIPDALCPTQPTHIGSSEQEDASVSEEEDVRGSGEDHGPFNENEADSRSSMLDTIDKLTEPTKCSLLDGTGHNLELAVATVYPYQETCHCVPVQEGYAVVQPTYVWSNTSHFRLPVPVGGDEITTLGEALGTRIQWSKYRILIPPRTRQPNSGTASGNRGTASDAGTAAQRPQEKARQQQQQICKKMQQQQQQQEKQESQHEPRRQEEPRQSPPKHQPQPEPLQQKEGERSQSQPEQQSPREEKQARKPLPKDELVNAIWTTQNPKYKPGVPMLSEADLDATGPNCARLHAYVMENSKDKLGFPAKVPQAYFEGDGDLMLNIAFDDVYDLITLGALDVSFLRLWTL